MFLTNALEMRASVYICNEHVLGCMILFISVMRCLEIRAFVYTAKKCSVIEAYVFSYPYRAYLETFASVDIANKRIQRYIFLFISFIKVFSDTRICLYR